MNYLESGSYLHGSNVDTLTLVTLVIYLFLMVRVGPD